MNALLASLLIVTSPASKVERIDLNQMIEAMAQVEGGAWGKPGGTCCMNYSAWSQHSNWAYQLSSSRDYAIPVYRAHLEWIVRNLPRNGIAVTPASTYLVWRRGLEGAVAILHVGSMPAEAIRCQNIYKDISDHRVDVRSPDVRSRAQK